jgi:hypothetical protein
MKKIFAILAVASVVFLTGGPASAQLPSQPYLFGVWEGVMTVVPQGDGGDPVVPPFEGEQFSFRLDIRDTNLVMLFPDGQGGWVGIGEGADLRLNQAGRSAIVVAAMSADEPTETWMLNLTRWDEETLAVYLSQLVSPDDANGQPARPFKAFAQMRRISSDG